MKNNSKLAFALGGLAGNNAHGVGFLEATLQTETQPLMISCSSGQIYWVCHYLECLKKIHQGERASLKPQLEKEIENMEPFDSPDLGLQKLFWLGKPGVFKPAGFGYFTDFWRNTTQSFANTIDDGSRTFLARRFGEIFPCRLARPAFTHEALQQMSDALNEEEEIGIVFNSYNPAQGCEYVYLNPAARQRLQSSSSPKDKPKRYTHKHQSTYRHRMIYENITPQAVLNGLWLYYYGFDRENNEGQLDGAFFRDIILSELTPAEKIYVVRPMHYHWSGDLPKNMPEMEDLKTKVAWNGSYAGERNQIHLMNKLLKGPLKKHMQDKYHEIEMVEIEMDKPRGFFGYVFEDMNVFDDAYRKSVLTLSEEGDARKIPNEFAYLAPA